MISCQIILKTFILSELLGFMNEEGERNRGGVGRSKDRKPVQPVIKPVQPVLRQSEQ